jgi:hypothetical protein
MTTYGYARVSTNGQDLAAQEAELLAAGCATVFKEKVSGAKTDRAELAKVTGQQADRAVALVFMIARERRMHAGLKRQIRRRRCNRLDARLLVVGDDGLQRRYVRILGFRHAQDSCDGGWYNVVRGS